VLLLWSKNEQSYFQADLTVRIKAKERETARKAIDFLQTSNIDK